MSAMQKKPESTSASRTDAGLADEIWDRYVGKPGMISSAMSQSIADRTERFVGSLSGATGVSISPLAASLGAPVDIPSSPPFLPVGSSVVAIGANDGNPIVPAARGHGPDRPSAERMQAVPSGLSDKPAGPSIHPGPATSTATPGTSGAPAVSSETGPDVGNRFVPTTRSAANIVQRSISPVASSGPSQPAPATSTALQLVAGPMPKTAASQQAPGVTQPPMSKPRISEWSSAAARIGYETPANTVHKTEVPSSVRLRAGRPTVREVPASGAGNGSVGPMVETSVARLGGAEPPAMHDAPTPVRARTGQLGLPDITVSAAINRHVTPRPIASRDGSSSRQNAISPQTRSAGTAPPVGPIPTWRAPAHTVQRSPAPSTRAVVEAPDPAPPPRRAEGPPPVQRVAVDAEQGAPAPQSVPATMDIEGLADKVWRLLSRRLATEAERRGWKRWP